MNSKLLTGTVYLSSALMTAVLMAAVLWPTPAIGQVISDGLSGRSVPTAPFHVETVLAPPTIRLQSHLVPTSSDSGGETVDTTLIVTRLLGTFMFSPKVTGEFSIPMLAALPGEGDTAVEFGNPRIGVETPIVTTPSRTHRVSFSLDFFLPTIHIAEFENNTEAAEGWARTGRYNRASGTLPTLLPDFAIESVGVVPGVHYRLQHSDVSLQVSLDLPAMIEFDLDQDALFSSMQTFLRYGVAVGYAIRPIIPTLEIAAVTPLTEDLGGTSAVAALGIRGVFGQFEPGIALTVPIAIDDDIDTSVYVSLELAFHFL